MRVLSKYPLILRCFILFTNTDEGVEHCFILFTNTDEGVEQVSVDWLHSPTSFTDNVVVFINNQTACQLLKC